MIWRRIALLLPTFAVASLAFAVFSNGSEVDHLLNEENKQHKVTQPPMPVVDDWVFLRRIYVDLIGRIPTNEEINEFRAWPVAERRANVIDKLLKEDRYSDRMTAFLADVLRLRSNTPGGRTLIAYVHQAVADGLPYDELCRRLISTNGKANRTPEVAFILGDDADPMAMASVTSQVFMGIRIGCAQCHNHPFDVWTREDFYGLAAYFGKTRRVESQLTKVIYTTENPQSTVLWPPEGLAPAKERKPMTPKFPFELAERSNVDFVARLAAYREAKKPKIDPNKGPSVDDLLSAADDQVKKSTAAPVDKPEIANEAKRDIRKIDIQGSLYAHSELRSKLAELVTHPRNRQFARTMVNRLWKELVGRGFVEPVDDFRGDNTPSHPDTLDYLAEDFVAHDYDLRHLVKMIVSSDAYQRGHAPMDSNEVARIEMEQAFLATPMRRMLSEALYDSIVAAGHLFDVKHPAGENEIVMTEKVRVLKNGGGKGAKPKAAALVAQGNSPNAMMGGGGSPMVMTGGGAYSLEDAIEVDFKKVLVTSDEDVDLDKLQVMSNEQIEAESMMKDKMDKAEYEEKIVKTIVDANPKFNSSFRMESPALPNHFLRIFGQPGRVDLGEQREDVPSMRQALMMLNGKLTHEASRVGKLERLHTLIEGEKANQDAAVRLTYREILTREPTKSEILEGKELIAAGNTPVEGLADLRWVLLNCNEFRYLP